MSEIPKLPRLVLRVGFAGSQKLVGEQLMASSVINRIFQVIASQLIEITPGARTEAQAANSKISQFYSKDKPLLRMISGLCEGADFLAANALTDFQAGYPTEQKIDTELAAVLPFDLPVYRASRPAGYQLEFDRLAKSCSYILTLDGSYEKPSPDTPLAKKRRQKAYRAQSALLLRQSDIIVAASDPDADGRAGGTMETVRAALEFDLPVVFLHSGTGKVSLIEPGDDPSSAMASLSEGEGDWKTVLKHWVTSIVADPDIDQMPESPNAKLDHEHSTSHGEKLLHEFFEESDCPPVVIDKDGKPQAKAGLGSQLWSRFESAFRSGPGPKSDPLLPPYQIWRDRSSSLSRHYSGLYRGAFLLNYVLAACAVFLAALSLVLLTHLPSHPKESHTDHVNQVKALVDAAVSKDAKPSWVWPTLLLLGTMKLGCVWTIYRNTHSANHEDWNDKAVDYRYLSERLRTLYYLPRIGSFQPPFASPPQYASRVVRQSSVDWLLDAIVRSVSPATLPFIQREEFSFNNSSYEASILRVDPLRLLGDVRDCWIKEQTVYHDRNARTMDRIHTWAENWGKVFNLSVIGLVVIDILVVILDLTHIVDHKIVKKLHAFTPWLIFLAAVLPAAVASLNGVRFQSECRRLAERSAVMRAILSGRSHKHAPVKPNGIWQKTFRLLFRKPAAFLQSLFPFAASHKDIPPLSPAGSKIAAADRLLKRIEDSKAAPATDLASWTPEVLRFSESVASVFVQEVAEWSVLYAKEVPEP